ncbi:MAG: copper chaperone PCu(A)C [Pseudomonadota bacterium]
MRWFAASLLLILSACGAPQARHGVEITSAWARPSPGGVDVAAGYLTIVNHAATADQLVSAQSPRATRVDVHVMEMTGEMMNMHGTQGGLPIPAGGALKLEPGGAHLMFQGVTAPFVLGESIPVTLHFAHAGDVAATLVVKQDAN